ncbi:MAG: carbohydrate ABC transporter permease [Clostridiales bacterium]|nr:carbohydrate ABC transporter permease [Clostridiales bacterium]
MFLITALLCIFPFYYMFVMSVSDNYLVSVGQVFLYPKGIHFKNYVEAFKMGGFEDAFWVTLGRTVLGTALTALTSAWMGYSFSKTEFWGRNFWFKFVVVTMYFSAGLIPNYLNYKMLGLLDTFWIYIIGFVSAYNILLAKTFIESLPSSLEESAMLDGAGYLTIFSRIVLPLSMPIIATLCVFTAVGHWSSYMDTVLYVKNPKLQTLQYLLYNYISQSTRLAVIMQQGATISEDILKNVVSATSLRMTVTMIVTIPMLFVYPFFQKYFVKGIMIGAIKG